MIEIRQWLIDIRNERGLSQKSVADASGVKPPTYWEYEHGDCTPKPNTAKRIASVLGFPWTDFFKDPK